MGALPTEAVAVGAGQSQAAPLHMLTDAEVVTHLWSGDASLTYGSDMHRNDASCHPA